MSTYLVAFAFGELQSKKTTTESGVEVGVFATKAHQPKELDFALEIAKKQLNSTRSSTKPRTRFLIHGN